MSRGRLALVLHSHLPYVLSHGRWPHGTDWLCEAAAETYLPILKTITSLVEEGCNPKLTIGLSPVLCEQLADPQFKEEFVSYLNEKIAAARRDSEEFYKYGQENMLANSHMWERCYERVRDQFNQIGQDIIFEFRQLQDAGYLEIMTCGATHGYLPLLSRDESLQAQVKAAIANYRKHFDRPPRGIWLPECAYRPRYEWTPPVPISGRQDTSLRKGVEEFLSENNLDYFVIDSALLRGGQSMGVYIDRFDALKLLWRNFEDQYQPRQEEGDRTTHEAYLVASDTKSKHPTAVYTRDPETGILVWSGEHGYPGDGHYLDFHKKRFPGGLRYWAVTSAKADLADKVEYVHESALGRIEENSGHFVAQAEKILTGYHSESKREGILVAPYDAELFGHWWFEGPLFLRQVLKKTCESEQIELTTLSEDLDRRHPSQVVSLPEGSWGQGNHHYIWLNEHTEWTWNHVYEAEDRMVQLARYWVENPERQNADLEKVLKQAARELMLLSASDWQFLISTFAARDYAELRLSEHFEDFKRLAGIADKLINDEPVGQGEWQYFEACAARDTLFEEIELDWFARVEHPA